MFSFIYLCNLILFPIDLCLFFTKEKFTHIIGNQNHSIRKMIYPLDVFSVSQQIVWVIPSILEIQKKKLHFGKWQHLERVK